MKNCSRRRANEKKRPRRKEWQGCVLFFGSFFMKIACEDKLDEGGKKEEKKRTAGGFFFLLSREIAVRRLEENKNKTQRNERI